MSKVAIQGNASGTGTFTIAAPNSNTDRTLVLPDEAGTVLTSASTIAGLGNLRQAEVWALEAAFTPLASGTQFITSNWAVADRWGDDFIVDGGGMSQSGGIFTFPVTGLWKIDYQCLGGSTSGASSYLGGVIAATTDNSTYNGVSYNWDSVSSTNYSSAIYLSYVFEVTNTGTHKVKFGIDGSTSGQYASGTPNNNYTRVTFIRLGDAQS